MANLIPVPQVAARKTKPPLLEFAILQNKSLVFHFILCDVRKKLVVSFL